MIQAAARHVIPISGKDSLTAALVQTTRAPEHAYEFMFNDVGAELPETYAWLDRVGKATGWEIERVGADLERIIEGYGILPSSGKRFCTKYGKIFPMIRHLKGSDAFVYYGLRADEARAGLTPPKGITPVYPLVEMGINHALVWTILERRGLAPPDFFWPRLHTRVVDLLGSEAGEIARLQPWERRHLFAGRSRGNCFFCFYQRQYEFIWLAEVHPDLFDRAAHTEATTGAAGYTWQQGHTLPELLERRDEILDRRAIQVARIIGRRAQDNLFGFPTDSEIALTGCGLLCGK